MWLSPPALSIRYAGSCLLRIDGYHHCYFEREAEKLFFKRRERQATDDSRLLLTYTRVCMHRTKLWSFISSLTR